MRVLLADDHDLVRDALKAYIETIPGAPDVLQASSFAEAVQQAAETPGIDVIILDLYMPGMNGFTGLEVMRERFPEVPVVILSGMAQREEVFTALRRGAAGFIPKTLSVKAMLYALQLVLAGEMYLPSMVLTPEEGGTRAQPIPGRKLSEGGGPLESLTPRERDVLSLLSKGLSNKEIASQLSLKPITVASHLKAVFRKLGAANRTQAAKIALEFGFSS